ncbi:outer membrane protein [Palleronia sp. KMU-117]|uniref:outer membrane protein n=1 Tax=Palleronia sp. KMU-117 TaxID=3434108 RepID=UPI003D71C9E1
MAAVVMAGGAAAQDAAGWDGWYLGASLDAYAANLTEDEVFTASGTPTGQFAYSGDGVGASFFTGRNWQRDAMVYGVEFGVTTGRSVAADINSSTSSYFYDTGPMLGVKGRAGYLVRPDTLVFASAGLSVGNLNYNWRVNGVQERGDVWSQGYSLGLGVERQIGNGNALRLGLDYLQRDSDDFTTPSIPALADYTYSNTYDEVSVSVGFTHYFGD